MDLDQRYQLLEKIGAGSYATVYRARDNELGREVAVKQIHQQFLDEPESLERYWSEAQLLASLQHPNIVTIFDIYRDRGWLILELMQGSLKDRLAGKQMDLRSLRAALAHCLRALKYLHERGVIHGDIKPGNMMIDHRRRVKIGDFGLSRRVSNDEGSLLKGTAKYIAPETVSDEFGEVGPHSDLYSLGFSCYELMCGSDNFEDLFPGLSAFGRDKQAAWMMWHAAPDRRLPEIPRVLEGVPEDLAHVVGKLVEKDPHKRYASAEEALSDLSVDIKLVKTGSEESGEGESSESGGDENPARDKRRLTLVIAAFAVSLLMSIGMFFMPGTSDDSGGTAHTTVGVVRSVDLDHNEVEYEELLTRLPDLLSLGDRPTIRLLRTGEPERFILPREIKAGDWIEIERSDAGDKLLQLTVSRPVVSEGTIRSVDTADDRVTVTVTEGVAREDLVMYVPDRTEVLVNNQPAGLRDLRDRDSCRVTHLLDPAGKLGHVVSRLSAYERRDFSAFIDEVDLERNELHLTYGVASSRRDVLPFADGAEVVMRSGEPIDKTELRAGDRVTVTADVVIYKVVVTREDQQLSKATITAIDVPARRLSVLDADRKPLTLQVPADAGITLQLESAELGDLRPEIDTATITYSEADDGAMTAASIDAKRGVLHDRWSLVVGTQEYADSSLSRLLYATADAQLVDQTLRTRYAMDPDWMLQLLDDNRSDAREAIQKHLARVGSGHQVIVYVVGHAYVGPDDVVYLALKDFSFSDMPATGLPLDWLVEQVESCKADRKLLLLDIVHAGRGPDLKRQPSLPDMLKQLKTPTRSIDVIGSAGVDQRGNDLPETRHGAFAYFVANGFSGDADADRNLVITGEELQTYLQQQFADVSLPGGATQQPFRMGPPSAGGG